MRFVVKARALPQLIAHVAGCLVHCAHAGACLARIYPLCHSPPRLWLGKVKIGATRDHCDYDAWRHIRRVAARHSGHNAPRHVAKTRERETTLAHDTRQHGVISHTQPATAEPRHATTGHVSGAHLSEPPFQTCTSQERRQAGCSVTRY